MTPKILIVDDTSENIQVLKGLLEKKYTLFAAKNGVKALKIATSKLPDLILLDIMMPEMDGYEVCQRLKADDATKEIPVIFVTAKSEIEDEQKGLDLGAVDYITKPIKPPILLSRVRTHIDLKEKKDALVKMLEVERELARIKEDIARISRHDLKTPINSIITYPKLMDKSNLTEKQIDQLDKIGVSGRKLLNMVNLSLDLFKMEMGTYQFFPDPVNIVEVLQEIFQENKLYIKSRRVTFDIQLDGSPGKDDSLFIVSGERLLIYSMLANLIKNALEASPRKETITIFLSTEPAPIISIHNKGCVPENIRDTFFEKYTTAGKESGTGLGTYSAKLIMDTHQGSISMDSSAEKGTTISIEFEKNE